MKRWFRSLLFLALAVSVLTVTVFADMGPKPQLTVKVVNPPEEPYYLDILAEGNYADNTNPFDGLEWSYSDEEIAALDQDLLKALRAAVPEGWHACTAEGSTGAPMWGDLYPNEKGLHIFGYMGVPKTYRILMVTKSGESWISEPYVRPSLQSSVKVDWAKKQAFAPPASMSYGLQFLSTLLPTLILEGALFLLMGFNKSKRNILIFLAANLITQVCLFLVLGVTILQRGLGFSYYMRFFPMELFILVSETWVYRRFFQEESKTWSTRYGIAANLLSAIAGWFLAEPVWRFIVSIS